MIKTIKGITQNVAKVVSFCQAIGITLHLLSEERESFLSGVWIEDGVVYCNPVKLTCVGDLLHELGHLAVAPATYRGQLNGYLEFGPDCPCKTCPWVPSVLGDCFLPETLAKTIVADMEEGRVQYCHSGSDAKSHFCAGALAYSKRRGELEGRMLINLAVVCGYLDLSLIDSTIETYGSTESMMEGHRRRCQHSL